jgi:Protein of unknown function DUF45
MAVRVAAPLSVSDEAVRLAVVARMSWIKRQCAKFEAQSRQSARAFVSGESHYFLGQRYRLNLIDGAGPGRVRFRNSRSLDLHVRAGSDHTVRERVFLGGIARSFLNLASRKPLLRMRRKQHVTCSLAIVGILGGGRLRSRSPLN